MQDAGGSSLSTPSVAYRLSSDSGVTWDAWQAVSSEAGSTFWTGPLGAGTNRVQFIAADTVGNMANQTNSVSVDTTAPAFSGFGPTVWVKSLTAYMVTITVREEAGRCLVWLR